MPRAPRTQMIGAMFAPVQIQNWWATVEVRAYSGMGIRVCSAYSVASSSSAVIDNGSSGGCLAVGRSLVPGCTNRQGSLFDMATFAGMGHDTEPNDGEVGARLRQLREQKGMSARQVAELAGVTAPSLSRLENGRVSPTVASL